MSKQLLQRTLVAVLAFGALAGFAACGDDDDDASSAAGTNTGTETSTNATASVPFVSTELDIPTSYPPAKKAPLKIGLLNPQGATEVLQVIFRGAKDEVEKLGGTSIELDAQLNPDTQISQFRQLLTEKVDAIGMYGIVDPKALAPVLKQAAEQKVPVIAWDITPGQNVPVPGFASQVWQGRDRLVYLQVKAAAEVLPKGAEVGIITPAFKVPLFLFTLERQKYWAQKFGLKVVGESLSKADTTVAGEQAATQLLAENPDIVGVLGYNDEPAVGAALAARSAGRREIKTFGMTGGSLARGAIDNGRLTASVVVDAEDMGRTIVQGLYNAAQGVKIPPVVISGDPSTVVIVK